MQDLKEDSGEVTALHYTSTIKKIKKKISVEEKRIIVKRVN